MKMLNEDVVNSGLDVRVPKLSANRNVWKKFYKKFPSLVGKKYYMRRSRFWYKDEQGELQHEERRLKIKLKKL